MQEKGVPTVDLSQFVNGDAAERADFVRSLGQAFHEVGFVAVVNHGISKKLVDDFYAASNQLVAAVQVTSTTNFAWSQFHGYSADVDITRVVLRDVGSLVLDDVQFLPTSTAAQLSLATYAGITIVGTLGHSYRIEYLNAVGGTNWTALTNTGATPWEKPA